MKVLILTSCLILSTYARPQYGGAPQKQKCRLVPTVEYIEEFNDICETKYEQVCDTKYKKECSPYEDEVCKPYQRRQCDNKRRQKCAQAYKDVPYSEEVCETYYEKECEKTWEENYGSKVWVDDLTKCQDVPKQKCEQVQKLRQAPYEKCDWEDYEDCYNVPDEKCEYVTKEKCDQVPYEDCQDQPRQECRKEHRKIPKQVQKKVCDGDEFDDVRGQNQQAGNGGYDAQTVSDAFSGAFASQADKDLAHKDVVVDIRTGGTDDSDKPTEEDNSDKIIFG